MPARFDEWLKSKLAELPAVDGGPDGWRSVEHKLRRREESTARAARVARWSAAASIAVLASVVAWGIAQRAVPKRPASVASRVQAVPEASGELERLRAQSLALETLLAALPGRPAIVRGGTALPIDTLEAQVQWLDHQLSGGAGDAAPADEERLWRERVEAMSSLVRLRYAEAQQVAM